MPGNLGSLGSLFIDLAANTATFESDVGRAQRLADRASKDMQARFATAAAAISASFVAGGTAVAVSVKSAIDRADELSKAAVRTGLTTEAISSLAAAGNLADVALGDLSSAIQRLNRSSVEAANGSKAQQEAFAAIGVSVRDAGGSLKDSYSLLLDTADGLSKVESGARQTALAQELFGKSGANLLPLLAGGKQGLIDAATEARQFGLVLSTEAGKQAEQFNDNLTRLQNLAKGAGNNLAEDLLPSLVSVSDELVNLGKESLLTDARAGIKEFTRATAINFAIAGEAVFGLLKTMRALGGSVEVVLNDIKAVAKFPGLLASADAKADYSKFLDERATTLRESGKRYTDLIEYNGTAISDALRKAFEKADAAAAFVGPPVPGVSAANGTGGGNGDAGDAAKPRGSNATGRQFGPMADQQVKDFLATLQQQDQQVKDFNAALEQQARDRERIAESLARQYGPATVGGVAGETARFAAELDAFTESREEIIARGDDYYALLAEAATAHQQELTRIEQAGIDARTILMQSQLNVASTVFGGIADLASVFGGKAFKAYKAFAIAEAITSTISGAIGAFSQASKTFPPPFGQALGAAAAAGVTASGLAQVARIRSTNIGSRRFGGPVAAGGVYEVAEPGNPELIKYGSKTILAMGSQPGSVMPAKAASAAAMMANARGGSGGVNIVVNNTAGDLVNARARRSRGLNGDEVIELMVAELDDNASPVARRVQGRTGRRAQGAIG